MLTIIYIYFIFAINVTYRPFKLRHVDDMDWILLKCLGWVISREVKGWTGLNKWKGKCMKTKTVDCIADSKRYYTLWGRGNVRLERAVSGRFSPLHAPFPLRDLRSALRSAPSFFCNARSRLRSAPPDFRPAPLRFPLRSRSAHMLCPRLTVDALVVVNMFRI